MIPIKDTKKAAQGSIKQLDIGDNPSYDTLLQASLNVKRLFKNPDKIFGRLKLQSVLHGAHLSDKSKAQGKDFLVNYGNSLVENLGKDVTLNSELLHHLKSILIELQKEHETVFEELVNKLCNKLEKGVVIQSDDVLNLSQEAIEMIVLNWIGIEGSPHLALLSRISASSPKLFQTVTSILYEALMRTGGHERVLEVTNEFIQSVRSICLNEKKDFLKLYPRSCCQIVSLLMISPECYSEKGKNVVGEVLSLLFEIFLKDRHEAYILLSHYSKWINHFKTFMYIKEAFV